MKTKTIDLKTAKLAKEKGLPESPHFAYQESTDLHFPSQEQLQKWLREDHHIAVTVEVAERGVAGHSCMEFDGFQSNVRKIIKGRVIDYAEDLPEDLWLSNTYRKYEDAMEAGLRKGLSLIQNRSTEVKEEELSEQIQEALQKKFPQREVKFSFMKTKLTVDGHTMEFTNLKEPAQRHPEGLIEVLEYQIRVELAKLEEGEEWAKDMGEKINKAAEEVRNNYKEEE